MTLSRFRSGFRDDLRRELFARGICNLEHAYQIVRDLYIFRDSYHQRSSDYKTQNTRNNSGQSQYKANLNSFTPTKDPKGVGLAKSVPGPTLALNALSVKVMDT